MRIIAAALFLSLVGLAAALTSACDAPQPTESPAMAAPMAANTVTVAPQGTTFDPPVKPEQIPPGHWYCDMDTVHYARLDKGDGKCPICGMTLKESVNIHAHPDPAGASGHGMH